MHAASRRRYHARSRTGCAIAALALVVGACGSADGDVADPDTSVLTTDVPVDTDPLFVRTTDESGSTVGGSGADGDDSTSSDADSADADSADADPADADSANDDSTEDGSTEEDEPVEATPTSAVTTTLPLVPDTGVPGIDSSDPFCQAWSQFAGSFRALGVVSVARSSEAALRLEVIASEAVIGALDSLEDNLPSDLEPERDLLLSGFAGPFGLRALRANEALSAAGVGGDEFELLADEWIEVLTDVGLDDPSLDVEVPDGVSADAVDAAARSFAAGTPPIQDDPSLTTFAEIPLTEAYTAANCPDAGTLAGNDDL